MTRVTFHTSSRIQASLIKWSFLSLLATFISSGVWSMEAMNPFRDFSKLRLEPPGSSSPTPMSIPSTTTRNPRDFYYSNGAAATEDVGVMFKPNFHDNTNMNSYTPDEEEGDEGYEMNPKTSSQARRPSEAQGEDELSGPTHNAGGPYYASSPDKTSNYYGKQSGSSPEGSDPAEETFFIPSPPSPSFIAEIEYDSSTGTLTEHGLGGLYDNNDQSESSDYFYNNQDQENQSNRDNNDHNGQSLDSLDRRGDGYEHDHQQGGAGPDRQGDGYDHPQAGSSPSPMNERFNNGYGNLNRNTDYGDY